MSDNAHKVWEAINSFRREPTYIGPTLKKYKNGLERINPKDSMIKDSTNLIRTLHMIDPVDEIRLSDELCEKAQEYLEKCRKSPPKNRVLTGKETQSVIPENFIPGEYTAVFFHDDFNEPDITVIKLMIDREDTEGYGRQFLTSKDITQCGIAVAEAEGDGDDDNSAVVIIFSEDEKFKEDEDEMERSGELWLAFQALDTEKKNRILIKDVCETLDEMEKDQSEPTLYAMLKELDDGKNESITWKQFSEHFNKKLSDRKTDEGRHKIYEVFKDKPEYNTIGAEQLKKIRDYLKYNEFTDQQIDIMLKMSEHDNTGVSYEDYVDHLEGKGPVLDQEEEE